MRVRVYNIITGQTLFAADITEQSKGTFAEYLEASGYTKHGDYWVNKRLGTECVIYND